MDKLAEAISSSSRKVFGYDSKRGPYERDVTFCKFRNGGALIVGKRHYLFPSENYFEELLQSRKEDPQKREKTKRLRAELSRLSDQSARKRVASSKTAYMHTTYNDASIIPLLAGFEDIEENLLLSESTEDRHLGHPRENKKTERLAKYFEHSSYSVMRRKPRTKLRIH